MSCGKFEELVEDFLEGELGEGLCPEVELHIFACMGCRELYEARRRAMDIYSRYLFDAEPPESWASFQKRLALEKEGAIQTGTNASTPRSRGGSFGTGLYPAFAGLIVIIVFVLVWLQGGSAGQNGGEHAAKSDDAPNQSRTRPQGVTYPNRSDEQDSSAGPVGDGLTANVPQGTKKSAVLGAAGTEQAAVSWLASGKLRGATDSALRQVYRTEPAEDLNAEVSRHLEKVELLLRSFRNARGAGTTAGFDVEYEKSQARKLLDRNAFLGRRLRNLRSSYAVELFNRSEAYLLEIANLGAAPSNGRVLEIKDRVRNQNIIASLQAFNREMSP